MSIFDPWFISAGTYEKRTLEEMLVESVDGIHNYTFVVASEEDKAELLAYALIQGKKVSARVSPEGNKKLPNMSVKDGNFIFFLTQRGKSETSSHFIYSL